MTAKNTDMTTNSPDTISEGGPERPDRRDFLSNTALIGGAMVVGFHFPGPMCAEAAAQAPSPVTGPHVPAQLWYREAMVPEINAWLTIAPDETVTMRINQTEIGTGVLTSNAMMVAEELQCDWNKVRVEYASANRNVREKAPDWARKAKGNDTANIVGNTATEESGEGVYGRLIIHSSGNIRENKYYLQLIGAEARERLLHTAAAEWKVPVSELVAKDSVVTHAKSKRRTTYGALAARAATMKLPYDPSTIRIKTPDKWTLMGTLQPNRDMALKVTGQAVFGSDIRLPGMLYAAVKACPAFGGDVKSYNFDAIKNRPGVLMAVRLPGNGKAPQAVSGGVAVVADSWWRAQTALDAMPIEWDLGQGGGKTSESLLADHMAALKESATPFTNVGNVDAAFASGAKIVEAAYWLPYCSKARWEPASTTVLVGDGRVDCWAGTQVPDTLLETAAAMTGVAEQNVYVHLTFMGGGYGSDQGAIPSQAVTVAMAVKGRPVQTRASRQEDWGVTTRFRPMAAGTFKAAVDAQGWPIAMEVHNTGAAYAGDQQIRGLTAPPYWMPNYRYTHHPIKTHVPVNTRRATGASPNCFYMESFIDELAHAAGKDPYQYRRDLIARNPSGRPGVGGFNRRNDWLKALDMVAKMSNWGAPLPEGWARGIAIEDRRRPSRPHSTIGAEVVTVEVTKAGKLRWHRVDIAFEEGYGFVHPLAVRKQIEGQMSWAYDEAVYQENLIKGGANVSNNVDTFQLSRMDEYPKQINISYFKTDYWIYGAGEEVIPQIPPALYNAVFKVTGKRFRSLPLKNHDLKWGQST